MSISRPPVPPAVAQETALKTQKAALVAQKAALEKKIAGLAQYQYLCWIPVWVPYVTNAVNPKPVMPGREIYVLWFHIGSFLFSLGSWIALRVYLSKLKQQVAALEAQINPPSSQLKPPIAAPF